MSRSRSSIGSNSERISYFVWSVSVSAISRVPKSRRYSQVEMKPPVGSACISTGLLTKHPCEIGMGKQKLTIRETARR